MTHSHDPSLVESWFDRRRLTLDLVGLTDEQRANASMVLGGSAAAFVQLGEAFDYSAVGTVVFRWGEPKAMDTFAAMLEHDDRPGPEFFPFAATIIIGKWAWGLAVQAKDFDPAKAYPPVPDSYVELPFDAAEADVALEAYLGRPTPRPQLLGRVGSSRWVAFELGVELS